jgi:hypothetical protein
MDSFCLDSEKGSSFQANHHVSQVEWFLDMMDDQQVSLRLLPAGIKRGVEVTSMRETTVEVNIGQASDPEFIEGVLVELKTPDTICLGVVERRHNEQVSLRIEHILDQRLLAELRDSWREPSEQ